MKQYCDIELDALREFISVGTGHAATALSKLIDKDISVKIPHLNLVPVGEVPGKLGGPDLAIVGLYFKVYGDIEGSILLFFPQDTANTLLTFLMAGLPRSDGAEFDVMAQSALMELGNILANSYVNALARMMDAQILISVPYFSSDALGAVVDFLLIEVAQAGDYALLMDTVIDSPGEKLAGNFIIFPDTPSLEKIFRKMGLR